MQKYKTFLFVALTLIAALFSLSGCGSGARQTSSEALTRESLQGLYAGRLPCADCPGITYKLVLKDYGTYTESSFYEERSEKPDVETGRYTIDGNTVVLNKKEATMKYFAVHPKGLQMLDINREAVGGRLGQYYILARGTVDQNNSTTTGRLLVMQKKRFQGIDFYALGNEPFWSLDIDFDKGMQFKSLTELSELSTPLGQVSKTEDPNVTRYTAGSEAGTLTVTVLREECADSMSGEQFPFRVRVEVKRQMDKDPMDFQGCGRYVVDYRLNDIWVLTRMNDRALDAGDFTRGLPVLEFHLQDNRVGGHSGCNLISGNFEVRGNKIRFQQLATTRMACPDMAFEQEFLSAITNKTLGYAINDGRLLLQDDEKVVLEFAKTD